jgi:hypothetical protein
MENSKLKQNNEAWTMRLRFTQQMLFASIKQIGQKSEDGNLILTVSRAWFSGFDETQKRMLPDGNVAKGAPFADDLEIRNEIIEVVLDGLKQRPRGGNPEPVSLYRLQLYEYDLLLAMCQTYQVAERFINSDDINPYEASALETTANTMMHVARTDEPEQCLYNGFDEQEADACPL